MSNQPVSNFVSNGEMYLSMDEDECNILEEEMAERQNSIKQVKHTHMSEQMTNSSLRNKGNARKWTKVNTPKEKLSKNNLCFQDMQDKDNTNAWSKTPSNKNIDKFCLEFERKDDNELENLNGDNIHDFLNSKDECKVSLKGDISKLLKMMVKKSKMLNSMIYKDHHALDAKVQEELQHQKSVMSEERRNAFELSMKDIQYAE